MNCRVSFSFLKLLIRPNIFVLIGCLCFFFSKRHVLCLLNWGWFSLGFLYILATVLWRLARGSLNLVKARGIPTHRKVPLGAPPSCLITLLRFLVLLSLSLTDSALKCHLWQSHLPRILNYLIIQWNTNLCFISTHTITGHSFCQRYLQSLIGNQRGLLGVENLRHLLPAFSVCSWPQFCLLLTQCCYHNK